MSKYKFRLSYKKDDEFIPIKLENLQCLKGFDVTEIKTIDNFTTSFVSYNSILEFLKCNKLINEDVGELFITIDYKEDGKTIQKPYAYSDIIFTKLDREILKFSYVYNRIFSNIDNGEYINNLINHYQEIFKNKSFWFIERTSFIIKEDGFYSLTPSEHNEYYEKLKEFVDFVFYKKQKDKKRVYYKNVRDFICYDIKNRKKVKDLLDDTIDENVGYRDGNDYIPPVRKK